MTTQRTSTRNAVLISVLFSVGIFSGCDRRDDDDSRTFQSLRDYIETIKVVDTHEHQRNTQDPDQGVSFYTLLATSYLRSDLISAGSPPLTSESVRANSPDENWETYSPYLELSKNTSYYAQFLSGFQKLYGYDEDSFTKPGIARLSAQIDENYRDFDEWYATAFERSNIDVWLVDPYWKPLDIVLDERYSALILDIDHLLWASANGYRLTQQENPVPRTWVEAIMFQNNVYEKAAAEGHTIGSLEDYLTYVGVVFDWALEHKVVGIKNSFAYMRSLHYEDVPFGTASALFDKGSRGVLAESEEKAVEDFLFHWIIQKAAEVNLPIQIHTGYQAGNGSVLEDSRPADLNNIFLQYPDVDFIIFHGGYPWTSQAISLTKQFPNVSIDLVWLPQISKEASVIALEEILDMVPYNKVFWGGDCSTIEEAVGSLESGKEVVARVLAARVERGAMSEEGARDVALKIFRENAVRLFQLEERLGRPF